MNALENIFNRVVSWTEYGESLGLSKDEAYDWASKNAFGL